MAKEKFFQGDLSIWMIYISLCIISLVEVFSATSSLTYKTGNYLGPIFMHACYIFGATVCMCFIQHMHCRYFKMLILLGIVFLGMQIWATFCGQEVNGGSRWISFGLFTIQPSELVKMSVVATTAYLLGWKRQGDNASPKAIKWIGTWLFFNCIIIAVENLSTACMITLVIFVMMYIGRIPNKQTFTILAVTSGIIVMALTIAFTIPDSTWSKMGKLDRVPTWKHRIVSFTEPIDNVPPDSFDIRNNAQVAHAYIAISSSSMVGKLPGNSVERDFLSQAFSDFIYAIIVEEMGLVGGAAVLILYLALLFRVGKIAGRCQSFFPAMLIMGLTLMMVTQAFINMLVAIGWFPVTGQPLPLISRGGTSLFINSSYIGIILSVSRYAKQKNNEDEKLALPANTEEQAEEIV